MKFVDRGMYYAMSKDLYLISKSNKLHTHKILSLTSTTENTHYKEAKYNMPCGTHMLESNPGD
jgi:hypothetical protein